MKKVAVVKAAEAKEEIHTGLTLDEIDQIENNIGFVEEALTIALALESFDWGPAGQPRMSYIWGEANEKLHNVSNLLVKRGA